jgi:hypothetical protein
MVSSPLQEAISVPSTSAHHWRSLPAPRRHIREKGTYYLHLSVLSNLVDLHLLRVGQGIVQGLWLWLLELTGGRWSAHHSLCGVQGAGVVTQAWLHRQSNTWAISIPLNLASIPTEEERHTSLLDLRQQAFG